MNKTENGSPPTSIWKVGFEDQEKRKKMKSKQYFIQHFLRNCLKMTIFAVEIDKLSKKNGK